MSFLSIAVLEENFCRSFSFIQPSCRIAADFILFSLKFNFVLRKILLPLYP